MLKDYGDKKSNIPVLFNNLESSLKNKAKTWEGGSTYGLRRQHIPGYKGFVPSIKSENLHGETFTKITATALKLNEQKKIKEEYNPKLTQYNIAFDSKSQFGKNKKEKLEIKEEKVLKTDILQNPRKVSALDRLPISGYTGHCPFYKHPLRKFKNIEKTYNIAKETGETILVKTVEKENIKKPIVGYKGFVPKIKDLDYHGKNFKDSFVHTKVNNIIN